MEDIRSDDVTVYTSRENDDAANLYRSSDLLMLDFSLCGYLKDRCFVNTCGTLNALTANIREEIVNNIFLNN